MRIAVNLMFVQPQHVGSSELLLTKLATQVAGRGHEVIVFGASGFKKASTELAGVAEIVETRFGGGSPGMRIAGEHTWLLSQLRRVKPDIVHHGGGSAPFFRTCPTSITIHDIQYVHFPQNFVKPKRLWLQVNVPYSARRSDIVCTPSSWVKEDVISSFGVDPHKVAVIPFGSEGLTGNPIDENTVRSKFNLERPFFLYPGRAYPHKNHGFLVAAFKEVSQVADLVFTGPRWFTDREIFSVIGSCGLTGRVRHLGLVSREELGGLYKAALALTFPSRFEGFGAPPLEAMSLGCPVIASNATAIPEVVQEAGILLDPDDLQGWTESMANVAANPDLRARLRELGPKQAAKFSWAEAATAQIKAYEQAMQ